MISNQGAFLVPLEKQTIKKPNNFFLFTKMTVTTGCHGTRTTSICVLRLVFNFGFIPCVDGQLGDEIWVNGKLEPCKSDFSLLFRQIFNTNFKKNLFSLTQKIRDHGINHSFIARNARRLFDFHTFLSSAARFLQSSHSSHFSQYFINFHSDCMEIRS